MTQTPKTKSMPISSLKHFNGRLFGTTTPLVGHWIGSIALVAVCPDYTPNPRVGRIFGGVASTIVLEVDPTTHSKF